MVLAQLHSIREFGLCEFGKVFDTVWCWCYDVVKLLHCQRSLGVGVYDVAMLLAELETT